MAIFGRVRDENPSRTPKRRAVGGKADGRSHTGGSISREDRQPIDGFSNQGGIHLVDIHGNPI